ncbi:MAG: AAA family ATPase, partial [Nitrospiraceae bacterium]
MLTGPAGVGKTAALRQITAELNPHRCCVLDSADTDFSRFDRYRNRAWTRGLEPAFRRAPRWREIQERIQ